MPGNFGWTVHHGRACDLMQAGFAHLERQPFIRGSALQYATVPNAFLIDRALGVWDPKFRGKARTAVPPSTRTIENFAYWLCNALEWAESRGVDLMRCDYSTVLIARYQQEMLKGIWSASGKPLHASTANVRVSTAVEYQMWASDKGLRQAVSVPTVTTTYVAPSAHNSRSHEPKTVLARQGKARVNPRALVFPSKSEIEAWSERIHSHPTRGVTEGLLTDLILDTASHAAT